MDYVWLIIIMAAAAVLPDLLRRKRRYPKRKGPIPIPPRKEEVKRKRQSLQTPVKTPPVSLAEKDKQPAASKTQQAADRPVASDAAKKTGQPLAAVTPKPIAAAPVKVPQVTSPEPWSTIAPEARDIYAGLVWAELLDKPVALRNKNR